MKMKLMQLVLALVAVLPAACQNANDAGSDVKKGLLEATRTAVDLDIKGYREKLASAEGGLGPRENVERFKARLAALEAERERFGKMKPEEYPAPVGKGEAVGIFEGPDEIGPIVPAIMRTIPVLVKNGYAKGSLLDVEGANRSGPFYRLAGIKGGCACVLKKDRRYELTVYLVYRREYFGLIKDYDVYVAEYAERERTGASK